MERRTFMEAGRMERIAGKMIGQGMTIATAEADTAGYIGHLLCSPPGASGYFHGGIIAYVGDTKSRVLGVDPELYPRYGAVSQEMALAMAKQARTLFGTDLGVSATGVAGPTGGSPQKPPGTFWIALSSADGSDLVIEHRWNSTDRTANKEKAADAAIHLLEQFLDLAA
jgi:PncC family amidohydrolase